MKPEDVKSTQWSDYEIIFNDIEEDYSAIWGRYRDGDEKCLGIRWNTSHKGIGYPTGNGGSPQWFVIPTFIDTFLEKLFTVSIEKNLKNESAEEYSEKIKNAIREFVNKSEM